MKAKIFIVIFLVLFTTVAAEGQYTVTDLAISVGSRVGISPEYLLCGLWVESAFFKNIGAPMAGLTCGKVNRDAVVFYGLAELFGKDPYTIPGSKAGSFGYGGAIGGGQVLPSTFVDLSGLRFEFRKIFSDRHDRYTKEDVLLIQRKLNKLFGPVLKVDGCMGPSTRHWVWQYVRTYAPQVAPKYVRDPGFVKTFFTIRAGYTYSYNPAEDRVAAVLGAQGPLDPWHPLVSATCMALVLREHGVQRNPRYAFGAYYAGPGGAYKPPAVRYAKRALDYVSWAIGEVDRYWLARGHRR